jgi:HK97 family phage major capsid protein
MDDEILTIEDTTNLKAGARNSKEDAARLQMIHDYATENGALCGEGNALKAISSNDDELRVGNYIVLFGGRDLTAFRFLGNKTPRYTNPDGSAGEFFSKAVDLESDYTAIGRVPINWEHGMDPDATGVHEDELLGWVDWKTAKADDKGIFVERVLNRRKKYTQWVEELVKAGLVGTSTEPVQKGVQVKQNGEIVKWPLKKDTLTVTPMEPRMMSDNILTAYKSLGLVKEVSPDEGVISQVETEPAAQDKRERNVEPETQTVNQTQGVKTMELDEVKLQELLTQAAENGAKKAIEATEPVKTTGVHIEVTRDEADVPFKSIAENLFAVKADTLSHGNADAKYPRLRFLKAIGASEGIPQDGGILLDPTLTSEFLKPIHEEGPFSKDAKKLPVGTNSNYGWINGVEETSRATGSRWGGIRGYRLAEAATKTASKPTFRRINWELKKYAAVVVATDELLQDSSMFSAIVREGVTEELKFMLNEDIYNGPGLAGPLGFMNSGALISVTRTDANKILGSDISAMWNRMDLRGRKNAKWYVSNDAAPQLDNLFAVGSTAVLYPWASMGGDGVQKMYSRPVEVTEFNESLGTVGDIVLADMTQYLLWEKGDIQEAQSIHVYFLTDETTFRFVYRVDGKPAINTPLTPYKGSTTTSPFVALSTAS